MRYRLASAGLMATKAGFAGAGAPKPAGEKAAPKKSQRTHRDTDCGRSGRNMLLIANLRCGYRVRCCEAEKGCEPLLRVPVRSASLGSPSGGLMRQTDA